MTSAQKQVALGQALKAYRRAYRALRPDERCRVPGEAMRMACEAYVRALDDFDPVLIDAREAPSDG